MKKFLKIFAVVLIVLIILLFLTPIIFKGKITEIVKEQINNNVHATVNFNEVSLSLIKSFPDFNLSITDLSIVGKEPFENYPLAQIKELNLDLNFMSVIKGDEIKINQIVVDRPIIKVWVLKDGRANYDVAPTEEEEVETKVEEEESASGFKLSLSHYEIKEGMIEYTDEELNVSTKIMNLNHSGNGNFTETLYKLKTETSCDELTVDYEGIAYLNKAHLKSTASFEIDMEKDLYKFIDNVLEINNMPLSLNGMVELPNEEDINMDLSFEAQKSEFKSLLSLIPAIYSKDFEGLTAKGTFSFKGMLKGTYNENQMPGFDFALNIEDGYFKYPDLPEAVADVFVDLNVTNPDGIEDNTVIDLKKLHLNMGGNPIDARLLTKTPISDPQIDADIKAQIDLNSISEFIPSEEGESYQGNITADISLAGKNSDLQKEDYEAFKADGSLIILDFAYEAPDMVKTTIKTMYLHFSPQHLELSKFAMTAGKSDFQANGYLYNYLAYYLREDPLKGSLNLNSNYIDLNEWMTEEESQETSNNTESNETESSEEMEIIEVPNNIDFTLTSNIKKISYDNKELTNIQGVLSIANQTVQFKDVQANMLEGSLGLNGSYSTQNINNPTFDLGMSIHHFDLPKTFETFSTIQKMAPIIKNSQGKFSSSMQINGILKENMEPALETINGNGTVKTHGVIIQNAGVLGELADQFKMEQFKKVILDDVNISFEITDGKIEVDPFMSKIGNSTAEIQGWCAANQDIHFNMNVNVPSNALGEAQKQLMDLVNGVSGNTTNNVNVGVLITGTVSDPKVKLNFDNLIESTKDNIVNQIENKVNEVKDEAINKAKDEAEKRKKEAIAKAKAEADKILNDAQTAAEKVKSEAKNLASKTRKEGENAANKIESEAKNPLAKAAAKKAADKVRQEANEKADKIESEANSKADKIMNEARNKADQKIKEAEKMSY